MAQNLTRHGQPQPINIWLESLRSQAICAASEEPEVTEAKAQKDEAILILLAQLALVYWRPDFTPAQAKELYAQYLDDLRDFPFSAIREAVEKYRRNGENKFYPSPGALRSIIETVPSWDVISKREHLTNVRREAQEEMQAMVASVRVMAITHKDAAE